MRKKLLVVTLTIAIIVSLGAYSWVAGDEGVQLERNQAASSDVADDALDIAVVEFTAVVNGMRSLDVCVCVNISDGLTAEEAELIAGTTFILVKGDYVTHRLDTLTFDDVQIEAHYTWGYDEHDMGHVFHMTADLTTLQITVEHCF